MEKHFHKELNENLCFRCKTPLRAIGYKRKNGKDFFNDWTGRQYHKKCFKQEQEKKELMEMLNKFDRKMNNIF